MTQVRLPKLRRVPEAVAGKRVTARGIEIIRIIYRYRLMTSSQLVRVAEGNEDVTYRHLQQLYHQGYVNRFSLPRAGNRGEFIYFLENSTLLRDISHRLVDGEIDWRLLSRNRERLSPLASAQDDYGKFLFVRHELMISDFHAALEIGCRLSGGRIELARWVQGAALWGRVTLPSRRVLPHRPDALFTLRFPLAAEGQQRSNFLYEADRATSTLAAFAQKLQAHFEFLKQGRQSALGLKRVRAVLVEAATEIRAEECRQEAKRLASSQPLASGVFWFKPQSATDSPLGAVWRTTSDGPLRSLVD